MINDATVFGSYRILRLLPNSSATYLAEHVATGERSVVKTYRGRLMNASKWAEVCTKLEAFPGRAGPVCALSEVGFREAEVFAVAPYLHGETLASVIKAISRRREVTERLVHQQLVCWFMADLIEGVLCRGDERFEHPVFDHDLVSPHELFVLFDGSVRVLDARWTWLRALATGSPWSSLERNLAYTLPKNRFPQAGAEAGKVWGLGVMLWELLVGYRLFRRDTLESTLHAVSGSEVPDPRSLNKTIPKALASLVVRILNDPTSVSLRTLQNRLRKWSMLDTRDAVPMLRDWLGDLFPDDPVVQVDSPASELDAWLDTTKSSWSAVEESTTCVVPPPTVRTRDVVELSWLEEATSPHIQIVERKPKRHVVFPIVAIGVSALASIALYLGPGRDAVNPTGYSRSFEPQTASLASPAFIDSPVSAHRRTPTMDLEDLPVREPERPVAEPSSTVHVMHARPREVEPEPNMAVSAPVPVSGDVYVSAPDGTEVLWGETRLGVGRFRTRLPVGDHVLRLRHGSHEVSLLPVSVKPGTLNVLEVQD